MNERVAFLAGLDAYIGTKDRRHFYSVWMYILVKDIQVYAP